MYTINSEHTILFKIKKEHRAHSSSIKYNVAGNSKKIATRFYKEFEVILEFFRLIRSVVAVLFIGSKYCWRSQLFNWSFCIGWWIWSRILILGSDLSHHTISMDKKHRISLKLKVRKGKRKRKRKKQLSANATPIWKAAMMEWDDESRDWNWIRFSLLNLAPNIKLFAFHFRLRWCLCIYHCLLLFFVLFLIYCSAQILNNFSFTQT